MANTSSRPKPTARPSKDRVPAQQRILAAAESLFLKQGVDAVTTDRLAKAASVSKTSIYRHFRDMAGVFEAVVRSLSEGFTVGVDEDPATETELWRSMVGYGENILKFMARSDTLNFDRMVLEQARNHPQMARLFYETAYGESHTYLSRLIAHGQAQRFITKPQPAGDLADHLLCMWDGLAVLRARLGLKDHPPPEPGEWSRKCVEALFSVVLEGDAFNEAS